MNLKQLTAQGRRNCIDSFAKLLEEAMPEIIRRCEEASSKGKTSMKVYFTEIFPLNSCNLAVDVVCRFSKDPYFLEKLSAKSQTLVNMGGRISFEMCPYMVCVSWDE